MPADAGAPAGRKASSTATIPALTSAAFSTAGLAVLRWVPVRVSLRLAVRARAAAARDVGPALADLACAAGALAAVLVAALAGVAALPSALAAALEQAGVDCRWQSEITPQQLAGQFDWLLDCRGFGAQADWNHAAGSRLRGVRGEVVRVYAPEVSLNRPVRLLHPRYPLYIAPKPNHQFVIGATQLESESGAPTSVRSGLELFSALYAVHPAFGEAQVLELSSGLRPTLNRHNPEIRFSRQSRMVEVNGLFRHGFMISPAVCETVVQLLQGLADDAPLPQAEEGLIREQG